jgi:hypothetical protein
MAIPDPTAWASMDSVHFAATGKNIQIAINSGEKNNEHN